ncbi:MAG: metallophosphoesterase family protein [Clostridiales bacterium]|nr:metallophosphoesterase family protein [Clostridiales bacterium]
MINETKIKLKFKNGRFRILIMSDLHGVYHFNKQIVSDIAMLLDREKPDLVIFNGDMVWKDASDCKEHFLHFVSAAVAPVEERQIPWAYCFGNHDDEGGFSRYEQQKLYESFDYCISTAGPEDVTGAANFVLPVFSSDGEKIIYNVFGLDSHNTLSDYVRDMGLNPDMWFYRFDDPLYPGTGCDTIRFNQVLWYWNTSVNMEKENGGKIPALMCFHIPLPEFVTLYRNVAQTKYRGNRREAVGTPLFNSGLFNAVVERGDVKTIVCGHDHINDFDGFLNGIHLAMDGGINYDGYCDDDIRGGRVVEISESDPHDVKTYMTRVME